MTRVRSRRAGHPARLGLGISVPGNSQRCPQRSLPSGLYLLASLPQTPPTILLRWDVDHDRGVPGLPPCQPHPLSVKLRPVLPLAVASNGGGGMAQGPGSSSLGWLHDPAQVQATSGSSSPPSGDDFTFTGVLEDVPGPYHFTPAQDEAPLRSIGWMPSWLCGSSCGQRMRGRRYSRTGLETGLVIRSLMFSFVGQ